MLAKKKAEVKSTTWRVEKPCRVGPRHQLDGQSLGTSRTLGQEAGKSEHLAIVGGSKFNSFETML